jgi:cephalosporin-C deacetylase
MVDVPFLCNFKRAVSITDEMPYGEITRFCKVHRDRVDQVFKTLAYFDGMYFATRATAPALFSAGLMDTICPPSTVFSAFNLYQGIKQIETYEFNQHDGGGSHHTIKQLAFLKQG